MVFSTGLSLLIAMACCFSTGALASEVRASNMLRHSPALRVHAPAAVPAASFPYRQRLENRNDMQYHGTIVLGGQEVDAIFDTGSFDLLVISQKCKKCLGRPQYNSSKSTSHRSLGDDVVEHEFGSGPTKSHLAAEELHIGPMVVAKQVIHEIVSHEIKVLDSASFDAIVGIGSGMNETTCNQSVLCQLNISEFSICLGRPKGSPGWLTWGSRLTDTQRSQAVELSNVGKFHWTVSMTDILPVGLQLGQERANAAKVLLCGKGCAAILDSGTSLIAAPSHSLNGLQALLPQLADDCSNWQDLPDLQFNFNGRTLRLPPTAYALKLSGSVEDKRSVSSFLHFKPTLASHDVCFFGFIAMDRSTDFGPLWIFGMPFFREFHVSFKPHMNASQRQIWLSRASETCEPLPVPESKQERSWNMADAMHKGVGIYPRVAVAQRQSKVMRTGTRSTETEDVSRGPRTVDAQDLLASGGLIPRLGVWERA